MGPYRHTRPFLALYSSLLCDYAEVRWVGAQNQIVAAGLESHRQSVCGQELQWTELVQGKHAAQILPE